MQRAAYYVRPYQNMTLETKFYNMPETRFVEDPNNKGFVVATLTNVPSLKNEPYMPPDDEVRRWVYLSYQDFGSIFQWNFLSMGYNGFLKKASKPSKEIKQKMLELTANASSEEEKLRRIYEFTQTSIKNVNFDNSITEQQRENIKINDADDVLKSRVGNAALWICFLLRWREPPDLKLI